MGFSYNGFFTVDFIIDNVTYNTHNTWGLIPTKKPIVKPPSISRDGQLTPGSNSWEFALSRMEDDDETYITYLEIMDALNGKRCTVRLHYSDHDPTIYKEYTGVINITDFSTDDNYSVISIDANLFSSEDVEKEAADFGLKYSINFVDKNNRVWNTFADWHLKPEKRPLVDAPKARTNYVITPGADGAIDLSEVLSGGNGVYFDNIEGEWTFSVIDEYYEDAADIFYEAVAVLNGKRLSIVTENGFGKEYTGRFNVSSIDIGPENATFKIGYIIEPYKVNVNMYYLATDENGDILTDENGLIILTSRGDSNG